MSRNSSALFPSQDDEDEVATNEAPAIQSGDDFKPNDELFQDLKSKCIEMRDHMDPWWSEAKAMYDMYAGRQWSEDDRQILEKQLRPVITFNRIAPVVDSLIGMEMNDRKMVQYYPRTMGDVAINQLYSSAAMWVREQSDAEDEESDAFLDLAICGMGWTDTHLVQDESEDGKLDIRIDRTDPIEMAKDPNSKKRNLADARMLARFRDIPLSEAEIMFPGFDEGQLNASWASDSDSQELVDRPRKYLFNDPSSGSASRSKKRVTIVEIQWWEKRPFWKVLDPFTQQITHFSDEDYKVATKRFKELSDRMFAITGQPMPPIQAARYKRKVYRRAFLGNEILKLAPLPYPYGFSYNCMTGKRDRNKRHWFGLIRSMKDPQEWANKWLSQILHIINSNAKGGLIAQKTTFEDWRFVERNYSRPDAVLWLAAGKTADDVGRRDPVQFPAGIYQLMSFAIDSIRDANGVNLEMMGLADRDQAASLEYQRRQSGMTVLAQFFNALRQYRKRQGRGMLYMIQKWLGDGRLVRITTDQGTEQYVPLLAQADEETLEYDVAVDEVASSPNQKEQVWSLLLQAMPFLQSINLPGQVWADIIKYSPLPDSLAQKIGQVLNVPPDQAQEAFSQTMQKLTLALAAANVKATNAAAENDSASARGKTAKALSDVATAELNASKAMGARLDSVEQIVNGLQLMGGPGPAAPIPQQQQQLPALPAPEPATQSPFSGAQ